MADNAMREAGNYYHHLRPGREGIPLKDIMQMIDGFKKYNARIDQGMKRGSQESKFRNFLFPFGKSNRAKNRKINYEISEHVTQKLESLLTLKREIKWQDLNDIFQHFQRKKSKLIYHNLDDPLKRYGNHIIRSSQLVGHVSKILTHIESSLSADQSISTKLRP